MCISASTVTGLVTIESSTMSTLQQVLLFILMSCGSTSFVSIVTVVIRRKFFKRKFDYLIASNSALRRKVQEIAVEEVNFWIFFSRRLLEEVVTDGLFVLKAIQHPLRSKLNDMKHSHISNHFSSPISPSTNNSTAVPSSNSNSTSTNPVFQDKNKKGSKKPDKITSDMVRRLDTPVRVNQMNVGGWLRDEDVTNSTTKNEDSEKSSTQVEAED